MTIRAFAVGLGLAILTGPFAAACGDAQAPGQEIWTPERSMKVRTIDSLDLSPDGAWIVYAVTETVQEESATSRTRIWLSRTDGSQARPLTGEKESSRSPAWAPDGKRIAFLSEAGGRSNIWLVEPFGAPEAWPLTGLTMGASSFGWSPDGREIAFLMADEPSEEVMAAMASNDSPRIVGSDRLFIHVHKVRALPDRQAARPARVTRGDFVVTGFAWSPDGRTIAFSHQPSTDYDSLFDNDISRVGADGGDILPLVRQPGWDLQPAYSPDGKWILFSSARGDPGKSVHRYHSDFALIPAAGGPVRYLAPTWSQSSGLIDWKVDGTGVFFGEAHGTYSEIYFLPVDGSRPIPVLGAKAGVVGAIDISRDGKTLVFAQEFMDKPVEIYVRTAKGATRQITQVNAFASGIRYAASELIRWKNKDGLEIEGLLTYPLDYRKGRRYPLLLSAHGGLYHHSQNHTARFTGYPIQTLAAEGFMILRPNPRGSNNQPLAFREAISADWSGMTYEDNIAGVDLLIEAGLADPDRLGVFGWSTGGFMTAWIIAKTDRFKAASIGAAPVDLVSFATISDSTDDMPAFFKTEVWQDDRPYREQSSVFHMKGVKTPCLILWGENDPRVPVTQGWQLYNTLKRQGTEVEFVIYPRSGHVPTAPGFMLDLARRNIAWFKKHVLGAAGRGSQRAGREAGRGPRSEGP